MKVSKLALGTVQFGLEYGINNRSGKVSPAEVLKILEQAYNNGITTLDTSYLYGESETVLGKCLKNSSLSFDIISKLPSLEPEKTGRYFSESLSKLNSEKIYGYLVHHFDFYRKNPRIWEDLLKLKEEGKTEKCGFSLYYPEEAEIILNQGLRADIVQVPYSILDQRFETVFSNLKKTGTEIHVRSVFLQGLLFKNPEDLSGNFSKIKGKISRLREISESSKIPVSALCLNFAVLNENIDKVVIGVDSRENLQENLEALQYADRVNLHLEDLRLLREDDEAIILPIHWNKN